MRESFILKQKGRPASTTESSNESIPASINLTINFVVLMLRSVFTTSMRSPGEVCAAAVKSMVFSEFTRE